jgi:adenylate kinase family enzyme
MSRIAVVGSGGAGKTTFANELGDRTGIPVVHLDHHYWNPGWMETPLKDWQERHAELAAGETSSSSGGCGASRSTPDLASTPPSSATETTCA